MTVTAERKINVLFNDPIGGHIKQPKKLKYTRVFVQIEHRCIPSVV